ncbi:hypothetical protein D3C72_1357730 [compost metagenome]
MPGEAVARIEQVVCVGIGIRVRIGVRISVGVCIRIRVGVRIGIGIGVCIRVGVGVCIGIRVGVRVAVADARDEQREPAAVAATTTAQRGAQADGAQRAECEFAQADAAAGCGLLAHGECRGFRVAVGRGDIEVARGHVDVHLLQAAGQLGRGDGGVGAAHEHTGQRRLVGGRAGEEHVGLAAVRHDHAVAGDEGLVAVHRHAKSVAHDDRAGRGVGQGAQAGRPGGRGHGGARSDGAQGGDAGLCKHHGGAAFGGGGDRSDRRYGGGHAASSSNK